MRYELVLVPLLLAACAKPTPRGPVPPVDPASPSGVLEVKLVRTRGGWDNGPDYEIRLHRGRPSTFKGVQEAARIGSYSATLAGERFDALAESLLERFRAQGRPDPQWVGCNDAPGEEVALELKDSTLRFVDACVDSTFIERFVRPVDSTAAGMSWHR